MILFPFILVFSLFFCAFSYAAEVTLAPIADPLTLDVALSFSEKPHPRLSIAELNLKQASNIKSEAEARTDLTAYLEGRLRYIEPSNLSLDQSHDDHRLGVVLSKNLYDSGRQVQAIRSAKLGIKAEQLNRQRVVLERRLDIMVKFFDVILADMNFYRYNEEIATNFISLDRLKDRLELGQTSDIDVMEKDVEYQGIRYLWLQSQNEQRLTRAKLAIAMGRPGELVSTITKPTLSKITIKLPALEGLQSYALKNNYELNALLSKLSAARAKLELAKRVGSPTINAEAASYAYSRDLKSHDEFQIGLVLNIPLFSGSRIDTETAKALNRIYLIDEDIALVKTKISSSILTLWLEFSALKGKLTQMQALTDYRELYLDRSRALYEMEVKTDLGDAMVRVSEAEREFLKTQYQMMLVVSKLELDLGLSLSEVSSGKNLSIFK